MSEQRVAHRLQIIFARMARSGVRRWASGSLPEHSLRKTPRLNVALLARKGCLLLAQARRNWSEIRGRPERRVGVGSGLLPRIEKWALPSSDSMPRGPAG